MDDQKTTEQNDTETQNTQADPSSTPEPTEHSPNSTETQIESTPDTTTAPAETEATVDQTASQTEMPNNEENSPDSAKELPCHCPTNINIDEWDKQKKQISKKFYKSFSPRIFYFPFSMAIDVNRAKMGAEKAGYKIPKGAMLVDKGGMFWSTIMLEIEGEGTPDKNVVELNGEYYCKASRRPWSQMRDDMKELEAELGHKPTELWMWYTACPGCIKDDPDKVKTIFLAK